MTTALIIDDNKANRDVLRLLLRRHSIDPIDMESPRELLTVLEHSAPIDVVFLDLEFPNYDGFELIHQLKALPNLQNVPVVAYTVHTSEGERAREAGFDSLIGKPLETHDFSEKLAKILRHEPVWDY